MAKDPRYTIHQCVLENPLRTSTVSHHCHLIINEENKLQGSNNKYQKLNSLSNLKTTATLENLKFLIYSYKQGHQARTSGGSYLRQRLPRCKNKHQLRSSAPARHISFQLQHCKPFDPAFMVNFFKDVHQTHMTSRVLF